VQGEMSLSKLDRYLNILEALVDRPLRTGQISRRTRMELPAVKRHLAFLVTNGVVEKRRFRNRQVLYAITERGFAVFKTLRALKYLQKLRDSLPIVEEAHEIASMLIKQNIQDRKR